MYKSNMVCVYLEIFPSPEAHSALHFPSRRPTARFRSGARRGQPLPRGSSAAQGKPGSRWKRKMATAAAASAAEPEADPEAGPEAGGEEDEARADRTRRKALTRAAAAATCKAMGPAWDQRQEEGVSESDGDEEFAMASSAESSPGEDEWEYDEEEEKNQLEIERLEEQVRPGRAAGPPASPGPQA